MSVNHRAAPEPSASNGPRPARMAALSFPADKDYLALVRTTAMHVAGLLALPIGRVTDLRLAVDEACSLFVAPSGGTDSSASEMLELRYDRYEDALHITVRGLAPANWPEREEIGWAMLRALVGEVRAEDADGVGTLTLIEPLYAADRPQGVSGDSRPSAG